MNALKYNQAMQRIAILEKNEKQHQEEMQEIRQLLFACVRSVGRIRIPALVADSIKATDHIHVERNPVTNEFLVEWVSEAGKEEIAAPVPKLVLD